MTYNFSKIKADVRDNIWWNTEGKVLYNGSTHKEWQAKGFDAGGLVADPLFIAPVKNS